MKDDFDLSESLVIDDDHLIHVCKYRQRGCCKYIVNFELGDGFYCVKNVDPLRDRIDSMDDMAASGDNCEGLKYEERSESKGASYRSSE